VHKLHTFISRKILTLDCRIILQNLHNETGIDLENIVYYKGETHYFVMTAKKHSLLAKGVLRQVQFIIFVVKKILVIHKHDHS